MSKERTFKKSLFVLAVMAVMVFAMTITASAASAVTGLKQTDAYTTSVEVKWTANLNEYYRVMVSQDRNKNYTKAGTTSNGKYYVSGLQAGRTYYVKVQTINYNGSDVYAETAPLQVVTKPESVEYSSIKQTAGTRSSITMTWKKVAGATGYIVTKDGGKSKSVTGTKATISASAGKRYSAKIEAYRKSESGYIAKSSSVSKYSLYASPASPISFADAKQGNLTWYPTKSPNVTLRWKTNTNYYYPDGYQLQIYTVDGKKKLASITGITSTSRTITSSKVCKAIKNKGFKVRIRAYKKNDKAVCYGSWSGFKTIIPEAAVKLSIHTSSSAKVTWPKIANAKKYVIYISRDTGSKDSGHWTKKTLSAGTTSYVVTGLKKFQDFAVYVIPVVKVNGKKYTAAKTWYSYGWIR